MDEGMVDIDIGSFDEHNTLNLRRVLRHPGIPLSRPGDRFLKFLEHRLRIFVGQESQSAFQHGLGRNTAAADVGTSAAGMMGIP